MERGEEAAGRGGGGHGRERAGVFQHKELGHWQGA